MNKKIIVKNPNHLPTTSYKNLKDLQGDLKTLSNENLEKLKQSIIKYGIFVPKFVWIENNKNYWIEDGHQTIKALAALEKEGYVIPDIPYVKVECENKKDAAEKLLQINSRYESVNPETTFFEDFDIDLDFINSIEIPELNIKGEEEKAFSLEDFIFENVELPCWFVVRSDISNYQEIKDHIEKLKEIKNTIIEDSNDGTY